MNDIEKRKSLSYEFPCNSKPFFWGGGEGLLAYAFLIGWLNNATIVNVDAHDICVESILLIGAF